MSKITRNFQITLPKDIRRFVNLEEGDEVVFTVEDNRIFLSKPDKDAVFTAAGLWKGNKETGEQYQNKVRAQWKKRQKALNW
jgi:AbrB family looped-hinge helix DNA binding protein